MSEVDKLQELSGKRAAMLAAMGVQVWHARGPEVLPEEVTADASNSPPALTVSARGEAGTIEPAATQDPVSKVADDPADTMSPSVEEAQTPQDAHRVVDTLDASVEIDRVEFTWVKGRTGMVLSNLDPDEAALQLIRDIVVFGDWVREQGEATKLSKGNFQWPQLLDTEGTPTRALAVFVEKHWPGQTPWIAIAGEVQSSVAQWLENIPVKVIELPAVKPSIRDAAMKKTIWQSLKASV